MTAVNIIRSAGQDVMYVATDGLQPYVNDFGSEPLVASKIHVDEELPLALAFRGDSHGKEFFGEMFCETFAEFDDVVAGLEDAFPAMHAAYMRTPRVCDDAELIFAGWSAARQRCEAYFIRGGDEAEGWFPPFRLVDVSDGAAIPPPTRLVPFVGSVESFMVDLMESQAADFPLYIGGFCQLTTLTQDSITQRILHRWPVDAMLTRGLWQSPNCGDRRSCQ